MNIINIPIFKIRTSSAVSLRSTSSGDSEKKVSFLTLRLDTAQMDEMSTADLIDMLIGTNVLDEQASIVHYLWMKKGPDFDTELNNMKGATVRALMEEIYLKVLNICINFLGFQEFYLLEKEFKSASYGVEMTH
ncbi:hypothetical protein WUBG_16520 [Wuchereria bancrofti]|uniref:Uncharacterized protein n=1 Tax=Wuchereria bancrofti TaxID=6293 RepID=J9DSH2_WUCBA|nr:hypothetical protein WUBG_16520 [Wuchereria bancrofti]